MTILDWPKNERPRERLLSQGATSLSDAELLSIFLRTGVKGKSAIDLSRELLKKTGSLQQLFLMSQDEFCCTKGLGEAKYSQLHAALEMMRRYFFETIKVDATLANTSATKKYLLASLCQKQQEVFACLLLDTKYCVIKYVELFQGGVNGATIYPGEVVKVALLHHATAVILAHNHPSGDLTPSKADLQVTRRLQKALALVEIEVLDHIIVGKGEAVSCFNG